MDEQSKEINKIKEIRKKLSILSESIAVGKNAKQYLTKHPLGSVAGVALIGFLTAILSGAVLRVLFFFISSGLKIAAFVFVARQTLGKVFVLFKKKKK